MGKVNEYFSDLMIEIAKPLLYFLFHYRIKVKGKENLPEGKAIIAANHTSYMDPIFLSIGLRKKRKKIYYLSKHFVAGIKYSYETPFSLFMKAMGHVLLEKEKFERRHLKKILVLLKEGKYFCMFPEGTRSYDGKIQDFKEGLTLISYLAETPILPVAIKDDDIWPRGKALPKPYGNVEIIVGKPIPPPKSKEEIKGLLGIVKEEMEKLYYS